MNEGGKSYDFYWIYCMCDFCRSLTFTIKQRDSWGRLESSFRQKVTIKNVTFSGGQSHFSSHKIVLFLLPLIFF